MFDNIKEFFRTIFRSRLLVAATVMVLLFSVLIFRMFQLQIIKGAEYQDNYTLKIVRERTLNSTRGNILDRNGEVLAYNELAYSITIEDNGSYDSTKEKNKLLNAEIADIITALEKNGDDIINNFKITVNDNGNYEFTVSGSSLKRFLADVFGQASYSDLKYDKKLGYNQAEATADQVMDYLKVTRFGISEDYAEDMAYEITVVRYAMSENSYQKYIATTIASDVSEESVAYVSENASKLQGVEVIDDTIRKYNDAEYFASIIGYTGQISQEEYDDLSDDEKKRYSLSDIVGKSGIEHTFDSVLQGEKGKTTFYVDNLGKVTDTVSMTDPKAGNDVYLTIDKNLQISAYKLLEEKLAGIVLSKLSNVLDYDPSAEKDTKYIKIPVGDAYNSFIANEIIDMKKFGRTDAKPAEQAVYNTFTQKKAEILSELMAQLQNENAPAYKDLSKEMKAYMDYICDTLLKQTTGILMSDKIEAEDETQIAWATQETISLNRYLNYAISKNWIDTSKLGDSAYSSSEEIYSGVLAYLEEYLKEDSNFDKLLYKYLIKSGSVTGAQICAIVYEQGVLPMDENAYNGLLNGTTDAYGWLYDKIKTLQITPGQLALEPCSGGIVVTDPNSGDVLACVSYPGYDNNRLANTMDSAYYNQLNTGRANIFYNRATQEKTAPGSTFKMISATAGLEEGYIDAYTTTYCSGSFNTVTPSPKCWIYPGGHGALNVVQSLQHSCNVFYYQLGYNMGIDSNGNYDSDLGTDKLRKYAAMYGLDRKSGVEIPEAAPQISDEYSIQSAIGQGTNNFTVSQLNRYVTAVANSGTVYDLTLIDKTTDAAGNLIKDYSAEVDSTMDEINSSTWDLIHQGMEQMVASSTTFTGLDFSMAGKTGTAQHNELHADHVLFVGYAPAEQPQLSIAVRITYGYNSGYASEIGRDIAKVYFNPETAGELITGSAANLGEGIAGD